jgi:prolyl-tRNA editing enzyme YbaK/EbsC (Cys-tRNA(Pro) deacylase)/SAM-dependent methyltransferase
LKRSGIHAISVSLPEDSGDRFHLINDFTHVPGESYDTILEINLIANEIVKRLRKKFHLVLSEVAAEHYGEYGAYATREVMRYEDEVLSRALHMAFGESGRGELAVDVGCGDGRHTLPLSRRFDRVIAFDLSRRMIEAARERAASHQDGVEYTNIVYYENDFEYEQFPEETEFTGQADFVCASFGMPSFVEDTVSMLRRFYKWLKPDGHLLLTFYNSQSMALNVATPWTERALSASMDVVRNALEVEIKEGVSFSIYCKSMDYRVMEMVKETFEVEEVSTFPHVMALLPPGVFGSDERPNEVARRVFSHLDREAAKDDSLGLGHYVFVVAKKGKQPREGYLSVLSALDELQINYEVIDHQPVISTREVRDMLDLDPDHMIKTVVFKSGDEFLVALVPSEARVNSDALAECAGVLPDTAVLASPADIRSHFGFPIGGIAPIGYDDTVRIFVDESLRVVDANFMYMGVGDNSKTLKMPTDDFLRATGSYTFCSFAHIDRAV